MATTTNDFPEDQFEAPPDAAYEKLGSALGDRRDGRVYVYDAKVRTAIRVADASGRPLLLRGPAGAGKSSLAPFAARLLKRRFYWATVTARTEARDLMWQFDALKRLNDAQMQSAADRARVSQLHSYIEPGVLWWAFSPLTAERRGLPATETLLVPTARDRGIGSRENGVVVLIDEIDKADPDLPNNLLECLGSLQFRVHETGDVITAVAPPLPLVMITTNDERELPAAFVRRCAVLHLREHRVPELVDIATRHFHAAVAPVFPNATDRQALYQRVAEKLMALRREAEDLEQRAPSTAEYLDAVRACLTLGARPDDAKGEWPHIEQLTLRKYQAREDTAAEPAAADALAEPVA